MTTTRVSPRLGRTRSAEEKALIAKLMLIMNECRKAEEDITTPQIATLLTIAAHPGESLTQIAALSGVLLGKCSRHVDKLRKLELIYDDYDAINRRRKVLTLTEKGERTIETLMFIARS